MSIYDHKPPSEGGLYLKIENGQTVKMRIASEPVIYESEFKGQLSTKYAWVIFNQDAKAAQVFQQSARFFRNVATYAQDEEWGDPQNYDIKVKREGVDTDTVYTITTSTNREPLSDEAQAAIDKVDLIKAIEAGRGNQRVMWLSEWDKQVAEAETGKHDDEIEAIETMGKAKSGLEKARATAEAIKAGKGTDTDDPADEIDLSAIPF